MANYYEEPVVITKAKGTYVEDVRGTKYLDFLEEFSQYPWALSGPGCRSGTETNGRIGSYFHSVCDPKSSGRCRNNGKN